MIEVNSILDEAAKAYFKKYYGKYAMEINGRNYLKVPDDGIYTYVYNVQSAGGTTNSKGEKYLEFIFTEGI